MKRKYKLRVTSHESRMNAGSALILTVVLTSLLAIVGVLFVMMARVNQIASSGLSESRELDSAIETVIAKISQELALDIPRKGPNDIVLSEYYDYPGPKDKWLASLEPYQDGTVYKWRQISDVTGYLEYKVFGRQDVDVELPLAQRPKPSESWVRDYPQINVDEDGDFSDKDGALATEGLWADADGDGIADSKWVELDDIASSKGKPIYAAIRIIDNGGMLNVNTAYKFDPDGSREEVDGSSQMQINLMALASRPPDLPTESEERDLREARAGGEDPNNLAGYETDVIWRYGNPAGLYTPFDISDELELRNRFLVNHPDIDTRLEVLEEWELRTINDFRSPAGTGDLGEWFVSACDNGSLDPNYAYRHIATTYNMDRIIDANGEKMVNINRADANSIYRAIKSALDPNFADVNDVAAQIAVNLIDFRDSDVNDTVTTITVDGTTYYGFERPCVYISELAHNFLKVLVPGGVGPVPGIQYITYRSYAIELHKPYLEDNYPDPNQWQLVIEGYGTFPVDWSGTKRFHVIYFEDPNAPLNVIFESGYDDPNLPKYEQEPPFARYSEVFDGGDLIELQRRIDGANDVWITVDSTYVPDANLASGWLVPDPNSVARTRSVQRDITLHKCIRRLWASGAEANTPTLGAENSYWSSDPNVIQAHPANTGFTNVGEIGMLFREDVYSRTWNSTDTEGEVRVDLAEPEFQQIFNYLTVWPPSAYVTDPNEARIKGRININTAPWYVTAQLPWVSQREGSYNNTALAEAIVAYRDKTKAPGGDPNYSGRSGAAGFENIGQLCNVNLGSNSNFGIDYYSRDYVDQAGFPDLDLPSPDGAADDFEERDVIFARISNLVTVRSDVFTAYILVRIGTNGPQKRVIAILDRSDVYSPTDRVKIVAVHPVADPR